MASKIDTIAALIVTHLEQISGLNAGLGPLTDIQEHPFAMVRIDPGDDARFMAPTTYSDRFYRVGILIEGTKANVSDVIEDIWNLWTDATRAAAMAAQGAWRMLPINAEEPFVYENDMAIGSIDFDMAVRYSP